MKLNIKDEWLSPFNIKKARRYTPKDKFQYLVSDKVINSTAKILAEYRDIDPAHEGLVYWAGKCSKNELFITAVIAPETISSEGSVTVPPKSNFYVVKEHSKCNSVLIAQVHSHPGSCVDHSLGDDEWASFKRDGLISVVVPRYAKHGVLPLYSCGIHRFQNGGFIRLSKRYIKRHFQIVKGVEALIDLRNKDDNRWKQQNGIN